MKKNKLPLIIAMCLAVVLVVGIICMCVIQKDYRPNFEQPYAISFKDGSFNAVQLADKEKTPEKYNKILSEINNTFKESFISSLFSGRLFFNSEVIQSSESNPYDKMSGIRVTFTYNSENQPKIKNPDGSDFKPKTNTNQTVTYTEIIFEVAQNKGLTLNSIYYVNKYYDNSNIERTRYYKQSFYANFDELYEILHEYF